MFRRLGARNSHVFRIARDVHETVIGGRKGAFPVDVIKARVMEQRLQVACLGVHELIIEIDVAVAVMTFGFFSKVKIVSSLLRLRQDLPPCRYRS